MVGLVATVLAVTSSRGLADDRSLMADVHCVIVGMQLAEASPSVQQSRGVLMAIYYLGRLDGQSKGADIEGLIVAEAGKMTSADYASETKRCDAGLTEKGLQITQLGQDLIARQRSK